MKKRILVVEAHSDDSAISAFGYLEKLSAEFEIHFFLVVASDLILHHQGLMTRDERLEEYTNYVKHFQGVWHRDHNAPFDNDSTLDIVPRKEVIGSIEKVIRTVRPDQLLVQGPSFHQDHTIVYESTIAATRPTSVFTPDTIYVMENPTYVHSIGPSTDFRPDFYVRLEESEMAKKIEAFKRYFPSQIRDDPNYLSLQGIKAWARYRGIESRCLYAEAFRTYRRVI